MRLRQLFLAGGILLLDLYAAAAAFAQSASVAAGKGVGTAAQGNLATVKTLIDMVIEFFVKYSFQVLGGIIVLVLGWTLAKYVSDICGRLLENKNVDVTVAKFLTGTVKISIVAFAVIMALSKFGIEVAPMIAGVSVAGFGLSFALQGPLSNYAAGATLVFTKPFKVGDIIEVNGVVGEVLDMKLPRTEIRTVDGHLVVVPNRHVIGEVIHNYSHYKRLDLTVGVSYKTDMDKALAVVKEIIASEKRLAQDRVPKIGISAFADSSVNIAVRVWCRQNDYLDILYDANKKIFDAFKANGIEIPFPQRDVHLFREEA